MINRPLLAALDAVERAMTTRYTDPRVQELADLYLADKPGVTDHDRAALAAEIQGAIEDWLEDRGERPERTDDDD